MAINVQYLLSSLFLRKITIQDKYLCASLKEQSLMKFFLVEKVQHNSITDSLTYVEYQQTLQKPKLKNHQSNENAKIATK